MPCCASALWSVGPPRRATWLAGCRRSARAPDSAPPRIRSPPGSPRPAPRADPAWTRGSLASSRNPRRPGCAARVPQVRFPLRNQPGRRIGRQHAFLRRRRGLGGGFCALLAGRRGVRGRRLSPLDPLSTPGWRPRAARPAPPVRTDSRRPPCAAPSARGASRNRRPHPASRAAGVEALRPV